MNTTAQNLTSSSPTDNTSTSPTSPPQVSYTSTGDKEKEAPRSTASEAVQEIGKQVEIPPDVEKAGVIHYKETMEIPPDIKKMGLTPTGSNVPVTNPTPQVTLPVADQIVYQGIHSELTNALKWLAIWCMRRLQKAHLALKKVHGKIIRVRLK
ncbi:hypothetical protein HY338_03915 [Candidatus Gottesmanbacteria bacterium]|nr:hypothetical protein [Candidatus Gottesmanbacteria bacterium]